ncbi:hypothetical protein M153_2450008385 [Pseudoloma neurophilia]|uniref:Uncharacterized protein n=1 Tax=Pseudoloma neurophilia TaxID=146866 RepID=A0A0R0M2W9_9MICR|nr:hypothetical protein M153_2450008385 [Pseudoloma neurophilia]
MSFFFKKSAKGYPKRMKKTFYKSRFFARRPPNVDEETVSYIERYLRDNRLPTKRGIMNSLTKWELAQKENNTNKYDVQVTKAKYSVPDLDIQFEISLIHLDDVKQQNVFKWVKNFENQTRTTKWNEQQQLAILTNIISPRILAEIGKCETTTTILTKLKKLALDNYSVPVLSSEFKACIQNRYAFIREYITELELLNTKVALSLDYSIKDTNILLCTIFFANLSPHTAIYLQKEKITSFEAAKIELLRLEQIIINETKKTTEEPKHTVKTETSKQQSEINLTTDKIPENEKCKIHPDFPHKDSDCIVQKRIALAKKRKDQNYSAALLTRTRNYNTSIDVTVQETTIKALCDSGSAYTLISEQKAKQNKLIIEESKNCPKIFTANHTECKIIGSVNFELSLVSKKDLKIRTKALVITNLAYDLILGRDFLEAHGFILNLRDGIIQTDYGPIEIDATDNDVFEEKLILNCSISSAVQLNKKRLKMLPGQISSIAVVKLISSQTSNTQLKQNQIKK